jgi:hypothetical protein
MESISEFIAKGIKNSSCQAELDYWFKYAKQQKIKSSTVGRFESKKYIFNDNSMLLMYFPDPCDFRMLPKAKFRVQVSGVDRTWRLI